MDERGREVLFKVNRQSDNATEVIASHLLVDELGQLGAIADEAIHTENGEQGVCTDLLPNHRKLKDAGLEAVSNPDQLVGQVIARDFLGDWDAHSGNYLVGPDGVTRSIDLGKAGNKGIVGSPTSTRARILKQLGTHENVQTYYQRYRELSDEQIQQMVERAGSHLEQPAPQVEARFIEAMIYQRDNFRKYEIYKDELSRD
ncbi:MAG: hypothetical protein J0I12_34580 [Candidatus Eremiobacteraeota bacterium]|nr:hypothetical protein [Candidatus Eremiobacteraeota bacterium]